ncbi:MAG TPA: hypothetical protein P5511_05045, partial [Candidatus Goldiibacteriota bacterium]|nr:hypothetical protein [Candidatus Goldiibacteriota bacterium]
VTGFVSLVAALLPVAGWFLYRVIRVLFSGHGLPEGYEPLEEVCENKRKAGLLPEKFYARDGTISEQEARRVAEAWKNTEKTPGSPVYPPVPPEPSIYDLKLSLPDMLAPKYLDRIINEFFKAGILVLSVAYPVFNWENMGLAQFLMAAGLIFCALSFFWYRILAKILKVPVYFMDENGNYQYIEGKYLDMTAPGLNMCGWLMILLSLIC